DDFAARSLPVDLIINHNIYAEALDYGRLSGATALKGPRYALIDPRFGEIRRRPRRRVLVSFGGSDDGTLGGAVAQALQRQAGASLAIDLVLSPLFRGRGSGARPRLGSSRGLRVWHGAPMHELMDGAGVL